MDAQNHQQEEQAVFNMAVDTLKRLSNTLEEIKRLTLRIDLEYEVAQSLKVGLVKHFFVQAAPLLKGPVIARYQKEVLKLKPSKRIITKTKYRESTKVLGEKLFYNEKLENRMDEILIELQIELQKDGYFMPMSTDDSDDF